MTNAWTEGPWAYGGMEPDAHIVKFGDGTSAKVGGKTWAESEANARLIALADEMAVTIQRYVKWSSKQPGLDLHEEAFEILADKLRQINAVSEERI